MKFLYTTNSPYARKARIVAIEKHVDIELQSVVLTDPDCPVKNYNPLGKVPVLIMDDGDSLYDSSVIAEFLDHRTPVAHLMPLDNTGKITVRRWEALAGGVCDAAVAMMLEQRKAIEQQDPDFIIKQLDKVKRGLSVLNLDLTGKKWCVNETFGLADIAVGCTLGYLDLRFKALNLLAEHPQLVKLNAALVQRASFKDTMPKAN
ncbi:MAG: glutathione S-transferase N-terminal domain-containing protein [Methylophilaceae bacterium]